MNEKLENKSSKIKNRKLVLILIVITSLFVLIGTLSGLGIYSIENQVLIKEKTIANYQDCSSLELEETANCLVDYVSTFYKYTPGEDKEKSLEELKINGGDCYDYNKLYEKMGRELGFESYSFRIENSQLAHRFAVIMNDKGYCLLDQINRPICTFFK